jgi:hypothetical protein
VRVCNCVCVPGGTHTGTHTHTYTTRARDRQGASPRACLPACGYIHAAVLAGAAVCARDSSSSVRCSAPLAPPTHDRGAQEHNKAIAVILADRGIAATLQPSPLKPLVP